ncbi:MAG: aminotransferase class I/II-fold pyridoxal phosphate-dependent enzyme [Eggerthellaceae bacterium]|nr:aminotransferase class I/II-fold pyridoxal phosphate-dependent enzyme [Eggerthellaceae bacterium]
MPFDFDTMLDRVGRDATAVDALGKLEGFAPDPPAAGVEPIPMWIADMNFPTAPSVIQAITERAQHPAFGYFRPKQAYYDAISWWWETRHGTPGIAKEHIGYHNGVLGGLASVLYAFTEPNERVLVHSPTYIGFTNTARLCKRTLESSPLVRDSAGVWRMDFDDMERRIVEHGIRVAIFCSPHNPCGRAWERGEIERAAELFAAHNVLVIADEIWADFALRDAPFIPYHTISEAARVGSITLSAPSKTFNLAGLQGSYSFTFEEQLRTRLAQQSVSSHYNDINVLSMHALLGAYTTEGAAWVDELQKVLVRNVDALCDFVDAADGLEAYRPEATYMVFIDCTQWCATQGVAIGDLEKRLWDAGVAIQDGRMFGGPCHLRANVALPYAKVQEAIERMERIFA